MDYMKEYQEWLASPALSAEEKAELEAIRDDAKEIEARFFSQLEFGTAGLRGTMGAGLYKMNVHVIRHTTQAFAEVILNEGAEAAQRGVAVCFDCRNNSQTFAREAACVMAANGIRVRLFESLRPTPELSFAIREYGCIAGINITASHNPKEYNGYKVYWEDGAQLPPEHASQVSAKMQALDVFACVKTMDYDKAVAEGKIVLMGEETDEKFLAHALAQINDQSVIDAVADKFKMVYTPFHGTGYRLIPEALKRMGMKHVICVPEQMVIDGNFPTVVSPNPENPEGFYLAVDLAKANGADFILGSDPDADRVGLMVRTKDGEYKVLTGNQTGALLLDYVIAAKRRTGKMPANSGQGNVIMSFEESYGYMLGSFVRDKDAVTAAVAMTEMAAWYYSQGMTLADALDALYEKYGYYAEKTCNLVMPGLDGLKKMAGLMAGLRTNAPTEIQGVAVVQQKDYTDGSVVTVATGEKSAMELSGSNVLRYEMADGTSLIVRPSGTEPKVKVYILTSAESKEAAAGKVAKYSAWVDALKG